MMLESQEISKEEDHLAISVQVNFNDATNNRDQASCHVSADESIVISKDFIFHSNEAITFCTKVYRQSRLAFPVSNIISTAPAAR